MDTGVLDLKKNILFQMKNRHAKPPVKHNQTDSKNSIQKTLRKPHINTL
jgi:hypothetical protein